MSLLLFLILFLPLYSHFPLAFFFFNNNTKKINILKEKRLTSTVAASAALEVLFFLFIYFCIFRSCRVFMIFSSRTTSHLCSLFCEIFTCVSYVFFFCVCIYRVLFSISTLNHMLLTDLLYARKLYCKIWHYVCLSLEMRLDA